MRLVMAYRETEEQNYFFYIGALQYICNILFYLYAQL